MVHINNNIDQINTAFNEEYPTTINTPRQKLIKYVLEESNNTTEEQSSTNTAQDSNIPVISEEQLKKIANNTKARREKIIAEGNKKFAEIETAREKVTKTGLSYNDALKILEDLPQAGFGVIRDDKTGKNRFLTVDEIYDFCKRNPDNEQAQNVLEKIDLARQTIRDFESKYPEVTGQEYQKYLTCKNFGI